MLVTDRFAEQSAQLFFAGIPARQFLFRLNPELGPSLEIENTICKHDSWALLVMSTATLTHNDQVLIYTNVVLAAWLTVLRSTTTGGVKPQSPLLVIAASGALRPL